MSDAEYVDHYEVLEVECEADSKRIKKAYRAAALKYHPDKNSSENATEMFRRVREAFEVLSDPESRRVFDEKRRRRMKKRKTFDTTSFFDLFGKEKEEEEEKKEDDEDVDPVEFREQSESRQEQQHQARQKRRKKMKTKQEKERKERNDRLHSLYTSRVDSSRHRTIKAKFKSGPSSKRHVMKVFERYGEVQSIYISRDFAKVTFANPDAASNAIWNDEFSVSWYVT